MTTLNAITLMPSTREQVEAFSTQVINEAESGNMNPLELKVRLKFLEACIDKISASINDSFKSEASKHGKNFEFKGYEISEVEAGTRYDYSNDAEWVRCSKILKGRENFLKNLKEPITCVCADTGEIETYYPPIKTSTTTFKFKMK